MQNEMTTKPKTGGALWKSAVIPFLVRRHNVWLMTAARVPCSNAANIEERKAWAQSEFCSLQSSVMGQEPPKCIYSKLYTVFEKKLEHHILGGNFVKS